MSDLLAGKVCLVTGTSRGIGKGIAEHFAREGAIVYASARKEGVLDGWASELSGEGAGKVVPLYFDVTDASAGKSAIEKIKKERGGIDVLVNNAGITKNELIGMITEESVHELFATNVFGPIMLLQYAARVMQRRRSGSIINISSIIGVEGNRGELVYSATKGAIISLTKSAAKELAPFGIRVNSVAPGYVETDMFINAAKTKENIERHIANIGLKRLATPDDIAEACVFLASDRSEYITGQILGVNGSTVI